MARAPLHLEDASRGKALPGPERQRAAFAENRDRPVVVAHGEEPRCGVREVQAGDGGAQRLPWGVLTLKAARAQGPLAKAGAPQAAAVVSPHEELLGAALDAAQPPRLRDL